MSKKLNHVSTMCKKGKSGKKRKNLDLTPPRENFVCGKCDRRSPTVPRCTPPGNLCLKCQVNLDEEIRWAMREAETPTDPPVYLIPAD